MSFKDQYRDMQEIARELDWLRRHNKRFQKGDPQHDYLLISEGALVLVALERFIRIVPAARAKDRDTLHNLLQKAVKAGMRLPFDDQQDGIEKIGTVRNTVLHGNFEQAAEKAGCRDVPEYFQRQLAPEVEGVFQILDYLVRQVDQATGELLPAPPLQG